MAYPLVRANIDDGKEVEVHVLMLTLMVALAVCVLLLLVFALFTISPFADRFDAHHELGRR